MNEKVAETSGDEKRKNVRSTLFGWKTEKAGKDVEGSKPARRPTRLFAPVYNGIGAALALALTLDVVRKLLVEYWLDGEKLRFLLIIIIPFLFCVSLVRSSSSPPSPKGYRSLIPYQVLLPLPRRYRRPSRRARRSIPPKL